MVDRSVIKTGSIFEESDEKAFWHAKSPIERIEAIEFLRRIAFGYDPTTARLQRFLEFDEFPGRKENLEDGRS
ncbi:hypothetical protein JW926_17520 [Candidatus Sumerlaeota bacterium]|nr:hypothetical protein [Candidatus Sumerlaeota bacterium]